MKYKVAIKRSDEGFSVSAPGLPDCWSEGAAGSEALENIKSAISEYLAVRDKQLAGSDIREVEVGGAASELGRCPQQPAIGD